MRYCVCGAYFPYPQGFFDHIKDNPRHYGIDRRRWKKVVEVLSN